MLYLLWTTDAHMNQMLSKVMESWGFKYVTVVFIWEKKTKNGKTVANFRCLDMKRSNEICLLGTKGTMLKYKKINNIVSDKVEAELELNIVKNQIEVRINIEKLFGDLPRIELFARQKAEGWDSWGNEV